MQRIIVNRRLSVDLDRHAFALVVDGLVQGPFDYGDTFALESAIARVKSSDEYNGRHSGGSATQATR